MRHFADCTGRSWTLAVLLLGAALLCRPAEPGAAPGPERWEPSIRAFEREDKKHPPPQGGILFVGSSSIRGWKLDASFPDLPVINRGFGGSHIADATHFADRIVLPYKPRTVVLYAGDNDIAAGKTPERVLADFQAFAQTIHRALPATRILFLSIKPSLARWSRVEAMRAANRLIKGHARSDERLGYVDVHTPMLNDEGRPRRELFRPDGLHLNPQGYRLWTRILRPLLTSR